MAFSYNNPYQFGHRAHPNNPEQDQVALFIDWDNLVISNYADRGSNRPDLEVLVRQAQQYGTVVVARAYAEWNITADRLEVYKAGIEPIYAPVFHATSDLSGQTSRGKSLADPVMVTDCIDFLHLLPQVGTYVLVTGDKDMVPVVRLARLRGRRVVVIGPDYVANVLQQVSDQFISYRFLLAQAVPTDPYAAYYQQQQPGYVAPPSPNQLPQGYYPPQINQPSGQQGQSGATDRRGRRISGRRGQSNFQPQPAPIQPYSQMMPPPNAAATPPMPQQPGYGYYGQPQQPAAGFPQLQPEVFQQPGASYSPASSSSANQNPTVAPGFSPAPAPAPRPFVPASAPLSPPAVPSYPSVSPSRYQPVPVPVAATPVITAQPLAEIADPIEASKSDDNFEEVKDAIRVILAQRSAGGRGQLRARDLKEELLRRIPNFSERRYGFSKFKALLSAAEAAGVLQIDQSGHILWVSAPGTPKMQFGSAGSASDNGVQAEQDNDLEDEGEGEEETARPEVQAELLALADAGSNEAVEPDVTPVMVEPSSAALPSDEGAIAAPGALDLPVRASEERTTSLVEAPIGAHREHSSQAETAAESQRPVLLEQPYYEDVIVLVDSLRNRNRWLGYELLLSNVRDYLSHQMPESEAKIQAGSIVSKLLNEGIIKMVMEVHSRGARKMTVKVAHLQEDNPAVRFAVAAQKAKLAAIAPMETDIDTQTEPVEALVESMPEAVDAAEKATYAEPSASEANQPDANQFEGQPKSQFEDQPENQFESQPEQSAVAPAPEGAALTPLIESNPQQTPGQELAEDGSGFVTQAPLEFASQSSGWDGSQSQTPQPSSEEAGQPEVVQAESGAEAGNLGEEVVTLVTEPQDQPAFDEPIQPSNAGMNQSSDQSEDQFSSGTESRAEPARQSEAAYGQVTGSGVEAPVVFTPDLIPEMGQHVQGEPEHAPPDEEPAPAGGFINSVVMEDSAGLAAEVDSVYEHSATGEEDQNLLQEQSATTPVELESEDGEIEEVEGEPDSEEAVQKAPNRRPRRRRAPPPE